MKAARGIIWTLLFCLAGLARAGNPFFSQTDTLPDSAVVVLAKDSAVIAKTDTVTGKTEVVTEKTVTATGFLISRFTFSCSVMVFL